MEAHRGRFVMAVEGVGLTHDGISLHVPDMPTMTRLQVKPLVPPRAISARSLKMLDKSAARLKKGRASAPIDLPAAKGKSGGKR